MTGQKWEMPSLWQMSWTVSETLAHGTRRRRPDAWTMDSSKMEGSGWNPELSTPRDGMLWCEMSGKCESQEGSKESRQISRRRVWHHAEAKAPAPPRMWMRTFRGKGLGISFK